MIKTTAAPPRFVSVGLGEVVPVRVVVELVVATEGRQCADSDRVGKENLRPGVHPHLPEVNALYSMCLKRLHCGLVVRHTRVVAPLPDQQI